MTLTTPRSGPELVQNGTFTVRETMLRLEPTVDVYVREKWIAGRAERLPVVLLHGAGMDGSGYDVPLEQMSLVDALAGRGSRTFTLDFRGHGRSSRVPDGHAVTIETSVADTLAVLDYVYAVTGSERAVLIGESFGSMVAPVVAERRPDRVAGLALLGLIYASLAVPADDLVAEANAAPCGYAFCTEEEWNNLFIPTASPAVLAWHQAQFGTAYAYPVGPYLEAAALPHTTAPDRIGGRILVVTGGLDPFASVADTGAFLGAVGTSHTRHLHQPDVGHMPYVERRAVEVQDAINELIDGCTAAPSMAL